MSNPVNVFAQKTPNPNAYKFPCSLDLLPEAIRCEYKAEDAPYDNVFIDSFFNNWPVERVYVSGNFVTVVKEADKEWFMFVREVREHIAESLRNGAEPPPTDGKFCVQHGENADPELTNWFNGQILKATEQDGGGIFIVESDDGELTLKLAGACYKCPYAPMTIEQGIVMPMNERYGKLKKVKVVG
ncbi:MAG: NifU N-terminal domain-containing protein [Bacteroidota bacterium]